MSGSILGAMSVEEDWFYIYIGRNIRAERWRAAVQSQKLADMLGVSRTYMSQVENGHKRPSLIFVWRASLALRVSIHALIPGNCMPAGPTPWVPKEPVGP